MADRARYDSAMFWVPFGTAAAVIGLALMTLAASRLPAGASLLSSGLFDGGVGLLALGALLLVWSLFLYFAHRRGAKYAAPASPGGGRSKAEMNHERDMETIRLFFAERDKLLRPTKKKEKKEEDPSS